jgi:hypothetical protein
MLFLQSTQTQNVSLNGFNGLVFVWRKNADGLTSDGAVKQTMSLFTVSNAMLFI